MFNIDYSSLFYNFPPELATFLIAMIPIAELRGALPVALVVYDLPVWLAYVWAVIGNLLPVIFLLWWLEPISRFLSGHFSVFDRFFRWLFARTRRRFTTTSQRYGTFIALVLFVAIPLPITGAWTGSVAAFIFGIPFKRAFPAIVLGVLIAGVIVTLTTVGLVAIF